MRTATIHELKQELQSVSQARLLELCLRLARFKKENKELLTYLLLEAQDEEAYIAGVKALTDEGFSSLPQGAYLAKKTLRKVLRMVNKYIRYTGSRQVEASLLTHYCQKLNASGLDFSHSPVLANLYQQQFKKAEAAVQTLHEDLQYDFYRELEPLRRKPASTGISGLFRKKK
ncbi:hypothetical protein [Sediminibacterium soli]|uniref:hypothetical protein n=1 Tax=Sediminibacterium soli TaxID=2698829 RepID=UPI00137B4A49|nr:hypothetical protein [Sediminibacterium soli]NCI48245.1 hypothetical protein [Sediminibacterium soli]